jgi:hypothetical protein
MTVAADPGVVWEQRDANAVRGVNEGGSKHAFAVDEHERAGEIGGDQ